MHWKTTPDNKTKSTVRFALLPIIDPVTGVKYWLETVEIQQSYTTYYDGSGFWQTTRVLPMQVSA